MENLITPDYVRENCRFIFSEDDDRAEYLKILKSLNLDYNKVYQKDDIIILSKEDYYIVNNCGQSTLYKLDRFKRNKFARVFETSLGQLLIFKQINDNNSDLFDLVQVFDTDILQYRINNSYTNEKDRDEAFINYTNDQAKNFINGGINFLEQYA